MLAQDGKARLVAGLACARMVMECTVMVHSPASAGELVLRELLLLPRIGVDFIYYQ
jgi:hypothetical protein